MDLLLNGISVFMEVADVIILMVSILGFRIAASRKKILTYALIVGLFAVINILKIEGIYQNTALILTVLFAHIFFEKCDKIAWLAAAILFYLISVIGVISVCIFGEYYIFNEIHKGVFIDVSVTVVVLITTVLHRILVKKPLNIKGHKLIVALCVSMFFYTGLIATYMMLLEDNGSISGRIKQYYAIVCVIAIVGSVLLILYSAKNNEYKIQSMLNEQKQQLLKEYYDQVLQNNLEIRRFRHDYKNHMRNIRYYIEQEKYGDLEAYMDDIGIVLDGKLDVIDVGNEFVSAILSDYVNKGKEMGIDISVHGVVPEFAKVTDIDWSIILSNALNNAIEAVEDVVEAPRYVAVSFAEFKNKLQIGIENPAKDLPDIIDGKIKTTKDDVISHGLGISNIKKSIEKYKGNIQYDVSDEKNTVTVRVIMIF
ncbi:MAG: GHKL domain-containing protein [Lachnospira sp.]|nr:GHKL domain-containing protein [Lachnospira sp.]